MKRFYKKLNQQNIKISKETEPMTHFPMLYDNCNNNNLLSKLMYGRQRKKRENEGGKNGKSWKKIRAK